jgi:hypothetical protein
MGVLLEDIAFWDVVWWIVVMFFWFMAIWLFVVVFGDIFRRRDLNGWAKAGWTFLIFVLPFLGILIYVIARPRPTESEMRQMQPGLHPGGPHLATADIAQAHELLKQGALTQAEFDEIKARALA